MVKINSICTKITYFGKIYQQTWKLPGGHFSLIWKVVYQLWSHGIWLPLGSPPPPPPPPKKKSSEIKQKNEKKTCELKRYLCFLEPIKSSRSGDVGNFWLAKQNVQLVKLIKHKKYPDVSNALKNILIIFRK